jgi:molecular chaperone DnaK (HSP70)
MLVVGGGITEIISTSGNTQLGGSVFDAKIAQHCLGLLQKHGGASAKKWSDVAKNSVVLSSEMIRIHLSNNRRVSLALPILEEDWIQMADAKSVILPLEYKKSGGENAIAEDAVTTNSTHLLLQFSRKDMERLCKEEFHALLRPLREVAIMAGALLPGDSSPSIVEAALELEEEANREDMLAFDDFYNEKAKKGADEMDSNMLLEVQKMNMKEAKKAQQRGRTKARNVAKRERKYRQEKRKLDEISSQRREASDNVKVRDGISGRPISRVVLVGGATRMPGIGRLIAALTGVVPQKTVNPDEAVALGCAVHAGVLDGIEGMGTVLNPMQAAILRAVAKEQGFDDDMDFDDQEFDSVDYIDVV